MNWNGRAFVLYWVSESRQRKTILLPSLFCLNKKKCKKGFEEELENRGDF